MLLRLIDEFRSAGRDETVGVVVVTGAGDAFCSGGDLRYVNHLRQADDVRGLAEFSSRVQDLFRDIELLAKPVVAAVNGVAYAGGLIIALVSDLIVASPRAKFCAPQSKLGLVDPYTAGRLAARVGMGWAKDLVLTGATVEGGEAYRIGLATRLVDHEDLTSETQRLASQLADAPGPTLDAFKSMFNRLLPPFDLRTYSDHMATEAAKAGVASFLQGAEEA